MTNRSHSTPSSRTVDQLSAITSDREDEQAKYIESVAEVEENDNNSVEKEGQNENSETVAATTKTTFYSTVKTADQAIQTEQKDVVEKVDQATQFDMDDLPKSVRSPTEECNKVEKEESRPSVHMDEGVSTDGVVQEHENGETGGAANDQPDFQATQLEDQTDHLGEDVKWEEADHHSPPLEKYEHEGEIDKGLVEMKEEEPSKIADSITDEPLYHVDEEHMIDEVEACAVQPMAVGEVEEAAGPNKAELDKFVKMLLSEAVERQSDQERRQWAAVEATRLSQEVWAAATDFVTSTILTAERQDEQQLQLARATSNTSITPAAKMGELQHQHNEE